MKSNVLWLTAVIGAALLVSSCAGIMPAVPETSPAAATTIDRLLVLNQELVDFKGIGRMKLSHSGRTQSARMVWAGTSPDKLRMDFMGAPGVPLATLSCDGKWVYLRLDQEKRFYKKKSGKALFKGMVDIPINVREAVQILGGKIPLAPHRSAGLIDSDSGHALVLKDRWGNVCQRIFFNSDENVPSGFEIVKPDGSISYKAEFIEMMNLKNYSVPKFLVMSNPVGERLELKVERYWVDQPLPPSRYVLQPTE